MRENPSVEGNAPDVVHLLVDGNGCVEQSLRQEFKLFTVYNKDEIYLMEDPGVHPVCGEYGVLMKEHVCRTASSSRNSFSDEPCAHGYFRAGETPVVEHFKNIKSAVDLLSRKSRTLVPIKDACGNPCLSIELKLVESK